MADAVVPGTQQQIAIDERGSAALPRHDVFLSYNGIDKPIVERIAELLKRERLEPWLDRWDLTAGDPWKPELDRALESALAVAVFVGPSGLSTWSRYESFVAIQRTASDDDFRLVPVLLPGLPEPFDHTSLPDFLSARTWVDLRGGIDTVAGIQDLINGIKGVPPRAGIVIEPDSGICPYRGLEVFDEQHAEYFFGREADIQRLVELLKGARFLAVLGSSGVGKSSLVRAGLLPALRSGETPGSGDWPICLFRPGPDPLAELAVQLERLVSGDLPVPTAEQLRSDRTTLGPFTAPRFAETHEQARLVLVVDQLEEMFTLCQDARERTAFIDNLMHAATVPDGAVTVVVTMRADFLPHCADYPTLAAQMAGHQYLVSPLGRDGLRQAIVEPARRTGLELERGLPEEILDDVLDQPGALPLLEHALVELWQRRRGRLLTLEGYHESGGVALAIGRSADEVFASLTPEAQDLTRGVLLRLIQVDESAEDVRRRVPMRELSPSAADRPRVEAAVQPLVHRRLLTTSVDDTSGEPVLEVAHEALIRAWPRLRGWIQDDRVDLAERSRLIMDVVQWQERGYDESALYRGTRLDRALLLQSSTVVMLNDAERRFLAAGVDQREHQRRTRQRVIQSIIVGVTLLVVGIATALVWALVQRGEAIDQKQLANQEANARATAQVVAEDQRDAATSRALAANALQLEASNPDDDPQLRLLLAREALRTADTPEARETLRQVLFAAPLYPADIPTGNAQLVAYSADFDLFVTMEDTSTITIQRLTTGERVAIVTNNDIGDANDTSWAGLVRLSPDGTRLITVSEEARVRLWDVTAGAPREPLAELYDFDLRPGRTTLPPECAVNDVTFSPDSNSVLVAADDGTAFIFNARTGDQLVTLGDEDDPVHDGWWSPDGTRVFTTSRPYCYALIGEPASIAEASTAELWDAHSGILLAELSNPSENIDQVRFTPDSSTIATFAIGAGAGDLDLVQLWDAQSGELLRQIAERWTGMLTVSPDSATVVMGGTAGDVQLWDLDSGAMTRTLVGHQGQVWNAAYIPDGTFLATVSSDTTTRFWETETGELVARTFGQVLDAEFSPDGRSVLTKPATYPITLSLVRLYDTAPLDASTNELLALAEFRITREFTPDERRQFLHE